MSDTLGPEDFMMQALELARQAAGKGEVPVGAVIVKNGEVIGWGFNNRESAKNALAHAEIEAIDNACSKLGSWRLLGCEIYVTLEPCPMCAGAIINSRIQRVFYGAADAKAGSCGSVIDLFSLPYNHHPVCEGGLLADRCAALLSDFFKGLRNSTL